MSSLRSTLSLRIREIAFRLLCRHRQGTLPNILLFCSRRGGSTWLLNTIAAHPGLRYEGRPFLTVLDTRWRRRMPDLAHAAEHEGDHRFRQIVHFEGEAERRFRALADDIIAARIHVYPSLAWREPYFHRVTNRVIFQMTSGQPLIEWFDEQFDVDTVALFRHPIPVALSIEREGWPHECLDFLHHRWFVDTCLTGAQVDLARRVLDEGSERAAHVLEWSLRMLVPYRALRSGAHPNWLPLTYEQIVTAPDRVVDEVATRLRLPDVDAMRRQVRRASRTARAGIAEHVDDRSFLLRRWRERVGPDEERALLEIPTAFGIDLYEPGRDEPADRFGR